MLLLKYRVIVHCFCIVSYCYYCIVMFYLIVIVHVFKLIHLYAWSVIRSKIVCMHIIILHGIAYAYMLNCLLTEGFSFLITFHCLFRFTTSKLNITMWLNGIKTTNLKGRTQIDCHNFLFYEITTRTAIETITPK